MRKAQIPEIRGLTRHARTYRFGVTATSGSVIWPMDGGGAPTRKGPHGLLGAGPDTVSIAPRDAIARFGSDWPPHSIADRHREARRQARHVASGPRRGVQRRRPHRLPVGGPSTGPGTGQGQGTSADRIHRHRRAHGDVDPLARTQRERARRAWGSTGSAGDDEAGARPRSRLELLRPYHRAPAWGRAFAERPR